MADLTVTAADVAPVFPKSAIIRSAIAAETITAGQSLFVDTAGKVQLADANAANEQQTRALALEGGGAGQGISILIEGEVYGFTLTDQAYDTPIFQSDSVGALADAAGTLNVPVGVVRALTDSGTLTKVLYFNARHRQDYS
jgi:hypothetical protein